MTRLAKPSSCQSCTGWEWTKDHSGWINPEGHGSNGVLIVGEAGGKAEAHDGLPFRPWAQSGSLLEKALRMLGTDRRQFRVSNILHCSPPNDWLVDAPYEFETIRQCRPNLDREIEAMKPRCILALGGTALRELTGLAGKYRGVTHLRGYLLPLASDAGIPVVGTFHPSFLRQGNPNLFGVLLHDIKVAMEIARAGLPPRLPVRYQTSPSLDDVMSFLQRVRDNPQQLLTYDIETPNSAELDEDEREEDTSSVITQIQFSLAPQEGIVFRPEMPHWMEIARQIIALPNPKAGHNCWLFDDPRMRANGFQFGGPLPDDTMWMWHHQQPDLLANLQFVASFEGMDRPWKHLSVTGNELDMAEYGCCDVDAPQRIMAKLPEQLRQRGLWDGYHRRTYQLRPILADMERRGIPINDTERVKFGAKLDAARQVEWEKMQLCVPEECREVHPKEGYKKEPKDKTGLVEREFKTGQTFLDAADDAIAGTVRRWCRIEPFTPSPKQLLRYMRFKDHPIPRHRKTQRDTTGKDELERLEKSTGDLLYCYVRTYRAIQTMKGTFVDGWKPSADGCVHTTFTFKPATAQLSSRDPNVQNGPQHVALASEFNNVIEAPDGYLLLSFDHKSFHALTLGFLAEDADYMRIARLDIHSFVTSEFLHLKPIAAMLSMPDGELADYLGWVKRTHQHVRDYKMKRVILGWQYGRGYKSIYHAYREDFTGEAESKRMSETLEGCFPKAVEYRAKVLHEADKKGYLTTAFGFIRWFWDVLDYRPPAEGKRRVIRLCRLCGRHHANGEQAEEVLAYRPANIAFGMMREEALMMREQGYDGRFGLNNNIHDAWKFCCRKDRVEEALATIGPLMERASTLLVHPVLAPGGLWCAVEAKVGKSEAAMEKVRVAAGGGRPNAAAAQAIIPVLDAIS